MSRIEAMRAAVEAAREVGGSLALGLSEATGLLNAAGIGEWEQLEEVLGAEVIYVASARKIIITKTA